MATTTLQSNNDDESDPFVIRRTWSSDEEETMMAGSHRGSKESEMKEILVKWQLPGNLVLVDAKKLLITLLAELMMSYPKDVQMVDSKQREWCYDVHSQEHRFLKEFDSVSIQLHPVRNKQQKLIKWVSITRFMATNDIRTWKDNDTWYSQIQEAKVYMFPHPFKSDEWDISSIGFIRDIHVAHVTAEYLHTTLNNIIQKQEKHSPLFQLIPQRITNNDKTATTRAYSVQCAKKDARQLIHLLTHGDFRTTPMFIPFKYKTTHPDVFTKCIRQQNEVYHRTWVIKLEGITEQAMDYIYSEIKHLNGVSHVVPTRRLQTKGEWKLLVDHTKCSFIHKQLSSMWQAMVDQIPEDILEMMPAAFASPRISSQKVRDYQDEASDNDSYGSILTTGTESSTRYEEEDLYNEPPQQYGYPSYAAAAAASTNSQGSPQLSSPTASATSEWQKEKRELEELLRQQANQIEKIQADLQAKISRSQDLEEQLAQAIELAHSRDARHEEMLQKFEQLMSKLSDGSPASTHLPPPPPPYQKTDSGSIANHVTPPSRLMTTHSPPAKKTNQNTTPTKPMYPVFRQTEVLSQPSQTTKMKRTQALLTQPMDTTEDTTAPIPGVQAGTHTK